MAIHVVCLLSGVGVYFVSICCVLLTDQSFGGNVTWPQAKERLSGDNQDIDSLSSSLPLESGHSLNGNGRLGSDGDTSTVVGSPKCFSIPGPLYKQGITDQCLHYNVHDSPKYLASR